MNTELYEKDFYEWTMKNVQLLRQGKLSEIDVGNIAEELESMGKSEKREFINRLAVLLAHLLKWRFQPEKRSKSWKYTVKEQRESVSELLRDSPSLKHGIETRIGEAYKKAVILVLKETPLEESELPKTCPYSFDQSMDEGFWPEQV